MATLAQPRLASSGPLARPALAIAIAAAAFAALVQSFLLPLDCDVSWLITVNEKMLSGLRVYVDVIEVNPPASIWLYTPAVWLAHQLQLRPEAVVVLFFIALALGSCAATLRISSRLARRPDPLLLAASLSFVGLVLPLGTFAQREHAALLLAAPALAALAVLAEGRELSLPWRLASGIAAGLVIAIKPHFALALLPAALFAAWRARALKPMAPAAAAALAVVAAYGLAVLVLAPDYLKLVPILAKAYLPLRERWSILLRGPVMIVPLTIYALALVLRPRPPNALGLAFLLGSGGFALAALIQGKGYLNHALPGMALGFVGLVLLGCSSAVDAGRRRLVLAATALLAALELYALGSIRPIRGLAQAVDNVAPPHPGIITLGPELYMGHPLARNVGGRWAGSRAALFIAAGAHRQLSLAGSRADPLLLRWYQADLESFARDVEQNHPDVILVDTRPGLRWMREAPEVRKAIAGYSPRAKVDDIEIWLRRSS